MRGDIAQRVSPGGKKKAEIVDPLSRRLRLRVGAYIVSSRKVVHLYSPRNASRIINFVVFVFVVIIVVRWICPDHLPLDPDFVLSGFEFRLALP